MRRSARPTVSARQERKWGLVDLDVRHGRRSETSGYQLEVCCKTRGGGERTNYMDRMRDRQASQERHRGGRSSQEAIL